MHVNKIFSALRTAWEELFDFPLPESVCTRVENEHKNNLVPAAFPLLGFILGSVIALAAYLIDVIINPAAAAICFTLIGWMIVSVRDSARGDNALGKYLSSRMQHNHGMNVEINYFFFLPGIIKFIMFLLLGTSGNYFYLIILLTAGFSFQAALAIDDECPSDFIIRNATAVKRFHIMLITLGIFCFFCDRLGTLAALAVVSVAGKIAVKRLKQNGFTANNISFAGNIVELFLLAAGVLTV